MSVIAVAVRDDINGRLIVNLTPDLLASISKYMTRANRNNIMNECFLMSVTEITTSIRQYTHSKCASKN
jgi:CheY-specific phosphatase CheX